MPRPFSSAGKPQKAYHTPLGIDAVSRGCTARCTWGYRENDILGGEDP